MKDVQVGEMSVSPRVIESIIKAASANIEGLHSLTVGNATRHVARVVPIPQPCAVDVSAQGSDVCLGIHIDVYAGYSLPDVANNVRRISAEAVTSQLGLNVRQVDVYVEALVQQ